MADGLSIFVWADHHAGRAPPGYAGRIHNGFVAWLGCRGWKVYRWEVDHDGEVHVLLRRKP